jgi:phage-related protein
MFTKSTSIHNVLIRRVLSSEDEYHLEFSIEVASIYKFLFVF